MSYRKNKKMEPGRKKGVPNLKRTEEGLLNQHGVLFTEAEKRALKSAVVQAGKKRREMLKFEAKLPRLVDGKKTDDTVASRQRMGYESDFILQPKTASLQRFKTREQYDTYMKNLHRVNEKDYIDDRIRLYKRNHMKAIERELGKEDAKDILMKIRMMKPKDYMEVVAGTEDDLTIAFVYSNEEKVARREKLRKALGMNSKEDYIPDEG